jgi:hypothetical protein
MELSHAAAAADLAIPTLGKGAPIIGLDRFIFTPGRLYTLQVHVKGGGVKVGVDKWDTVYNCGQRDLKAEFVAGDCAWYDVLTPVGSSGA